MGNLFRTRHKMMGAILTFTIGFTALVSNGCAGVLWEEEQSLSRVKAKGELTVLTVQSPLIYSQPKRGLAFGIDYDLLESFSKHYGLKLKFVVLPDEDAILRALQNGEGDIAAARLKTPNMHSGLLIGPAYEETHLSLFCHKKERVQNISDLANKSVTLTKKDNTAGLSFKLRQLSPTTEVRVIESRRTPTLLKDLSQQKMDCIIAENFSGEFHLRYFNNIEKITQVTKAYSLNWLVSPDNGELLKLMQAWYMKAARSEEITKVIERYHSYLTYLSRQDITRFFSRVNSILPIYQKMFLSAAQEHNLSWQLVAAIAYQESHWNPDARSFTGVRGMMQITQETARHLGIEDRTDPAQSIWGGSKYIRSLINLIPEDINSKDRLALALAAYNIGYAHLLDAQELARKQGKNPHSWRQLKTVLPLLADPEYASQLKYGAARGYETVEYVERVKSFYNIIAQK